MNIVQLNNFIEKIVSCTETVKSFYTNSVYECWNTEEVKYGSISFCITKTQMRERTMTYDAIIYYGDRLLEDKSNRNAIWSDATQVIQSIIGTVNSIDGEITISYPYNLTLFEQKFADELAGAYAEISIEVEGIGECGDLLYGYEGNTEDVKLESIVKTFTINGEYDIIPSDGFDAISDVKVIVNIPMQSKSVTYSEVGDYQVTPDPGYEALSKVDVKVSLEGKPIIPNGFRFGIGDSGIGDPDLIEWDKYDWSMVYDANSLLYKATPKDDGWFDRFKRGFNGNLIGMRKMFNNLQWKGVLDFEGLDTSKVVDMNSTFNAAWVTEIKNLNTSNVVDMSYIFQSCNSLNIPQMDTSKVVNMRGMFRYCRNLTTIPQIDTSNVGYMDQMFASCENLTTIPQLDTSSVVNMERMFYECKKLIDIPQMDTSKVYDMGDMFQFCDSITTIPQLDISKVGDMSYMFYHCEHLVEVKFKGKPSSTLNVNYMFEYVKTNGTLYYDSRYDYSKIINKLPSTWTAVPYDVLN